MPEEQQVAVCVLDFESPQTIITIIFIFEWLKELYIARGELCRQCIRIGNVQVSIPSRDALFDISRVVRYRIDTDLLEDDHRRSPLYDPEEDVVRFGPLKRDLEPETVAIKRERGRDISDDEERRNTSNVRFRHDESAFRCRRSLLGIFRITVYRPKWGELQLAEGFSPTRVYVIPENAANARRDTFHQLLLACSVRGHEE